MKNVVSNKNKLAYCKWHSVEVKKEAATKELDNCITHSLYKQPTLNRIKCRPNALKVFMPRWQL